MSNNTIFRKYLDILNESATPKTEERIADPEQITYAETAQGGSVAQIIESVKAFQRTVKLPETGALDPKTLAAIMSHSARLAEDAPDGSSTPMPAASPAAPAGTPASTGNNASVDMVPNDPNVNTGAPAQAVAQAPAPAPVVTREDLENKAELHTGYGQGLRGGSHHDCSHEPGSGKHLHWHHGYAKGAKEYAECMGGMGMKSVNI